MTPIEKLEALRTGKLQPRLAEKGLPYYAILPVIEKKPAPKQRRDWYPLVLMVVAIALVFGLIVGNQLWWR